MARTELEFNATRWKTQAPGESSDAAGEEILGPTTQDKQLITARRISWQQARANWLNRDLIWPVIEDLNEQRETEKARMNCAKAREQIEGIGESKDLDAALESLQHLVDLEADRQNRVETRLAGTLGVFVLVSPPPRRGFTPDTLPPSDASAAGVRRTEEGILHSKEVT